jgi:Tol biopolymer transport system component
MKKFFIYVFAAATLGVLLIVGLFSKNVVSNPVAHYDLSKIKIAYVVRDEGGTFIYVINPDGSNKTKLTAGSMPYWSSFGKKIAYAADKDGNRDIYYMDEDGSNITRLTSHPDGHVNPAWSPDGTKIV